MTYRHELKHIISRSDMITLRQRLRTVAKTDVHVINSSYDIRSLYFDDPLDAALREKLDGVNRREKFRLRSYNHDFSLIHLEKKSKINGLGTKESASLTAGQVQALLDGDCEWMRQSGDPLIRELLFKMTAKGLRPKTIVDYTREPYIFPAGNVRVTIDYNIRTGLSGTDFLNPDCITIPARDAPVLLEVKWDAFLPDIIRHAVQLQGRGSCAFSKYAICRMYG